MLIRRFGIWGTLAVLIAALLAADLRGEVTSRQRSAINVFKRKAQQVEALCREDKYDEAAEALAEIQTEYDELLELARKENDKELVAFLEPLYTLMLRPHARMELEGVELKPLVRPELDDPEPLPGAVSFRDDVAPILVAKCGRCHVDGNRGMFSMATFAALMKGSEAGTVISPKDDVASRLIEVIESGDMPRGGLRVTADELSTLKTWIREGARYDGGDPNLRISTFVSNDNSPPPTIEVARPTGNESVSFANDLAPVLAASCAGCHGNGNQNAGQLNLAIFEAMLRGGDGGPPVMPGQPGDSLLIGKLKGTAGGERMPRGRPPLADDVIARFEKWIEEGATFDGHDPRANVAEVAARARALRVSHAELASDRAALAEANWRLGMARIEAERAETDTFLLLGNIGQATLADLGKQAESLAARVADLFRAPDNQPLIKGRMTIFALSGRYDYSEFGKMVERRDLPTEWRGHWRFTITDAYGTLVASRGGDGDSANEAMLIQLIAGTYISSLGSDVPRWFSEGAARAAVAKLLPKDPRVAEWDAETSSVLAMMRQPDDLLEGKLSAEASDIASYRYVSFLMTRDARRFQSLLKAIGEGQPFTEAFAAVYNATPAQVTAPWLQYEARSSRRR